MFYNEDPPNPSERCKYLAAALKEAFSHCHAFGGKLSSASPDEEQHPTNGFDDEEEVPTDHFSISSWLPFLGVCYSLCLISFRWLSRPFEVKPEKQS